MMPLRWIALPVVLGLCLPPIGCGLFRRRGNVNTNVSSNVEINQQGRDVATLRRDEYEVIDTSIGTHKARSIYLLGLPVGSQSSPDQVTDSAYYNAVDRIPECDALMMPRVDARRTYIPLLLVNIVIRRTTVKGRCIHIKDEALADPSDIDEEESGTDTGGGGEPEVPTPPPVSEAVEG